MEALERADADQDEEGTHENGSEDAPEEHAVLQRGGNLEVAEDEQEEEEIVDAEHQLDEVGGEEVGGEAAVGGRRCTDHPVTVEVEQEGECGGQSHPERGPAQGFAESDGARGAVEDAEIEHQHEEHEGEEQDPRQGRWHDRVVFGKSAAEGSISLPSGLEKQRQRLLETEGVASQVSAAKARREGGHPAGEGNGKPQMRKLCRPTFAKRGQIWATRVGVLRFAQDDTLKNVTFPKKWWNCFSGYSGRGWFPSRRRRRSAGWRRCICRACPRWCGDRCC